MHMDDVVDLHAGKLLDILANQSLHQHVNSSTHRQGHILDLIITREIQHLQVLPIDPPMLSDHSPVVADCACQPSSVGKPTFRQVRNWRNLDVNAFAADLETRTCRSVHPMTSTQRSDDTTQLWRVCLTSMHH